MSEATTNAGGGSTTQTVTVTSTGGDGGGSGTPPANGGGGGNGSSSPVRITREGQIVRQDPAPGSFGGAGHQTGGTMANSADEMRVLRLRRFGGGGAAVGAGPPPPPPPGDGSSTGAVGGGRGRGRGAGSGVGGGMVATTPAIRPFTGTGAAVGGNDEMAEAAEWAQSPRDRMAEIHTQRLQRIADRGADHAATFRSALGDMVARRRRSANAPRPALDLNNPCNMASCLPILTPAKILELEPVIPKPPLPYGYSRCDFDTSCVLQAFNDEDPGKWVKALKSLVRALDKRHLTSGLIRVLLSNLERVLEGMRLRLTRCTVAGHVDENAALLEEVLGYLERMLGNQQVVFHNAREQVRRFDQVGMQCGALSEDLKPLLMLHPCMRDLVLEIEAEAAQCVQIYGWQRVICFEREVQPRIVWLRCFAEVLRLRSNAAGRRLLIHDTCPTGRHEMVLCRGRLASPQQGRSNPNWTGTDFVPLHFHGAGYAESLIYSWLGANVLYVHGIVGFHMDKDMSGGQRNQAAAIEALREHPEQFVEYFLFGEEFYSLAQLLAMSLEDLDALRRRLM